MQTGACGHYTGIRGVFDRRRRTSHWPRSSLPKTGCQSSAASPSTSRADRMGAQGSFQQSHQQEPVLSPAVRERVAQMFQQLPLFEVTTTERDSSAEDDQLAHDGHPLRSGMQHTAVSMVVKKVTWPHKVIYTEAGKPVAYEELSIPLFVHGYLIIMRNEKDSVRAKMASHLDELMDDVGLYSWDKVRAYHTVWLNQIEQKHANWEKDEKMRFQHGFILPLTTLAQEAPPVQWHQAPESSTRWDSPIVPPSGLAPRHARPLIRGLALMPTACLQPLPGHGGQDLPTPGCKLQWKAGSPLSVIYGYPEFKDIPVDNLDYDLDCRWIVTWT